MEHTHGRNILFFRWTQRRERRFGTNRTEEYEAVRCEVREPRNDRVEFRRLL